MILPALLAVFCAQAASSESQELQELRKRLEALEKKAAAQQPPNTDLPALAQSSKRDAGEVYSKPFLARFGRNVYLGGYLDLEFHNVENSKLDTFDQHRFVPFIYADVTKNIKVAAEIEIEHGHELEIEFAHIDYWLTGAFNFRAGIILDPLGHFNLVHDAPFQDLALRPYVNTWVIPTVLREPGVGIFGSFDLDPWEIDYEVYLVNGFKGLDDAGNTAIDRTDGLREARPHEAALGTEQYKDHNDNKAVVGRISVSPFLGFEVGGSFHTGKYDESGDNRLTIWAIDGNANLGGISSALGLPSAFMNRFEAVGEYAAANIERNTFAKVSGIPGDFAGYFVEGRFHFFPDFMRFIPGTGEESTFTLVYRRDWVDLDGSVRTAHTFGINFRPLEDTVIKFEFQRRREHENLAEVENDAFVFSIATYF